MQKQMNKKEIFLNKKKRIGKSEKPNYICFYINLFK